jgi:hypothetical protein
VHSVCGSYNPMRDEAAHVGGDAAAGLRFADPHAGRHPVHEPAPENGVVIRHRRERLIDEAFGAVVAVLMVAAAAILDVDAAALAPELRLVNE